MGCCASVQLPDSDMGDVHDKASMLSDCKEIKSALPWLVKFHHRAGQSVEETTKKVKEDNLAFFQSKSNHADFPDDLKDSTSGFQSNCERVTREVADAMDEKLRDRLIEMMPDFVPWSMRCSAARKAIEAAADKAVDQVLVNQINKILEPPKDDKLSEPLHPAM